MDRYQKLAQNTLIFTIGTFSSKLLVFFLVPIYTNAMTSTEFSIGDTLIQTANLLIPFVTLGISNSIIRFGMDRRHRQSDVFSTGIYSLLLGTIVLTIIMPFLSKIDFISGYSVLLFTFIILSSFKLLCNQFTRANGNLKLFALDGVLSTLFTLLFTILFLVVFHLGVGGYLLATICSDLITSIILIVAGKLWRYTKFSRIRSTTASAMIRYAIPMIPTTVSWWIINVSDRYLVRAMISDQVNGLYSVAYKVPSIVVLISGIFMDAWQVSAFETTSPLERQRFFSKVCNAYQTIVFLASSVLILSSKLLTQILVADSYYTSWKYVPLLILATTFSCFVSFLGSIYMAEKKSGMIFFTTVIGAVLNIVLNILLIPPFGANGAAFATFFSYFAIFLIRAIHSQSMIPIRWNIPLFTANLTLLFIQCYLMVQEPKHWIWMQLGIFLLMTLLNLRQIMQNLQKFLSFLQKKKKRVSHS
ncbi:MAG: lipopolysaccharide biosynthesis protein [Massiliimalia sp.]